MNEVLGLVDALEALILDAKKIPMTDKVVLTEKTVLQIIDKIRLSVKNNGSVARRAIDVDGVDEMSQPIQIEGQDTQRPTELLRKAQQEVQKMKEGADDYADYILANLQLMVTKLQKNLVKLEKNIESGREVIDKRKQTDSLRSQEESFHENG